ncbi:hypothetical protein OKW21_003157 [Catalinimonas alkaloidigena]|uniref:S41 family peptidase n=1 Tax=Catalinimonas alkaloidigena TaxID=1075417 RepID=UPI002406AD2E|nr:S41 family peptidase [Catalinimonas alkaloidigena]MDF9797894.1 hypothetical protein [Catalinimonas alkaloidigena]
MKYGSSLLFFIFPLRILAQTELSQEQITEDFTIFKNILSTAHPGLYEYTTKEKWDSLFSHFENEEAKQLRHSGDFFQSLCALADHVKDGHLIVQHAKMDTIPKLFPLLLKIIEGKLYTDTNDHGIPIGSQIISINGIGNNQLINTMLKYASSDGFNLTKKYRQIETEFGILHYYEFGEREMYEVVYNTPAGLTQTIIVESQDFERVGNRHAFRTSHFSLYHNYTDKARYYQERINEKWPYLYAIDSINTLVLRVNSFGLNPKAFKSRLIALFKEIRKKRADNVIVDVRSNNGGYRINAIHLFSFLTDKPFQQRVSEYAITSSLPEEKYLLHADTDYQQFFATYFASAEKEGDGWVLKKDHAKEAMKPYKRSFKKNIFVLIGGRTFSAGSAFALNAKNDPDITLVGEETGGGYYFHNGQFSALYKLPNAKIMVRMSFVKINHYVTDNRIAKGSGVIPDIEVKLSVQDLIEGKDSQLDYVVKTIQKLNE